MTLVLAVVVAGMATIVAVALAVRLHRESGRNAQRPAPSADGASADENGMLDALRGSGFTVQRGSFIFFTLDMCDAMPSCYAQNPETPYGLAMLPRHPRELAGEDADGSSNYTSWCAHGLCTEEGFSANWRVAPGEAVLLVGRSPPPVAYWSFTPYLFSRYNDAEFRAHPESLGAALARCPAGPSRCEMFFGANDPLNLRTIRNPDANAVDAPLAVLLTWDPETEVRVKSALLGSAAFRPGGSYANDSLNVLRYPGALARLGVSPRGDEDDFMVVMRAAEFKSASATRAFYRTDAPFRAYRVTLPALDGEGGAPPPGFPSFERALRPRATGVLEGDAPGGASHAALSEGLRRLEAVVAGLQRRRSAFVNELPIGARARSFVRDSGYECLHQGLQCQGDCRDTIYAVDRSLVVLGEACSRGAGAKLCPSLWRSAIGDYDVLVVVGVHHRVTRMSTYASVTLYSYPKLASVATAPDELLTGSAEALLPGHPAAPFLYAVQFARDCDEFGLRAGAAEIRCVDIDAARLPLGVSTAVIERSYMHPVTHRGPAVNETILPVVFHFAGAAPEDPSSSGGAAA